MPLSFAYRKTAQMLNFLASQNGGRINKMKALKLVYFADRFHLRKYGRPITNDEYYAMNYGPVASGAKDLAEGSDFCAAQEKEYAGDFIAAENNLEFRSLAPVDFDVFSETDREALNYSWDHFHHLDKYQLAQLTHRYPEWLKHEASLSGKSASRAAMSYADFLEDPEEGVDPCHPLTPEDRAIRQDELQELKLIHSLWN